MPWSNIRVHVAQAKHELAPSVRMSLADSCGMETGGDSNLSTGCRDVWDAAQPQSRAARGCPVSVLDLYSLKRGRLGDVCSNVPRVRMWMKGTGYRLWVIRVSMQGMQRVEDQPEPPWHETLISGMAVMGPL